MSESVQTSWGGGIFPEGVGHKAILLLKNCAEHYLLINNTVFRLPSRTKISLSHPRSKH